MTSNKQFYVTTPIYYVNDRPHIGHVYTTTIADVLARYHRLLGHDVFFLTGTDEHATKVVDAAAEQGVSPQEWADTCAGAFEDTFSRLNMTNDDFIRTSQDRHKTKTTQYVKALLASGDVYLGDYEGWYDAGQEEYITEGKAEEYDFKSPFNGKPLVRKTERNYFFKLSAYRQQLLDFYNQCDADGNPFVQPQARKKEILNRIAEAQDVPISRTGMGDWGIKIPGDDEHTIYVWIDALFNYLSTVDTDDRRGYWQSGAIHLIAKDILWFHAAIWPAVLTAIQKCEGYGWVNLPAGVYSHSFWISEGRKMSKSLGNFIDLEKIDYYVETFSLDALRYFLATRGPMGTTDSDFAESKFAEVYNSDLANTFGNSCSRVTNMIGKYFDGQLPASQDEGLPVQEAVQAALACMERLDISGYAEAALGLVRQVDSYIENTAPFRLAKDPKKLPEVGTILYNSAETLRIVSVLLWPLIPDACEKVWERMGLDYKAQMDANTGQGQLEAWVAWGLLKANTAIEKGDPLFPRYQVKK